MPMAANPVDATVPSPIAVATPVMISQIGLVRLPAATKAADGRRMASTNAHTSTISAARASTSKNQLSAEYAPGLLKITLPGYPLRTATWNGTQRSAGARSARRYRQHGAGLAGAHRGPLGQLSQRGCAGDQFGVSGH